MDEKRPKGTPLYMAPEVWLGREFNEKADVYRCALFVGVVCCYCLLLMFIYICSFGIVLWELLSREPAFAHHSSLEEFKVAITVNNERPTIPADCLPSYAL